MSVARFARVSDLRCKLAAPSPLPDVSFDLDSWVSGIHSVIVIAKEDAHWDLTNADQELEITSVGGRRARK